MSLLLKKEREREREREREKEGRKERRKERVKGRKRTEGNTFQEILLVCWQTFNFIYLNSEVVGLPGRTCLLKIQCPESDQRKFLFWGVGSEGERLCFVEIFSFSPFFFFL
jgi:hypothetical protein